MDCNRAVEANNGVEAQLVVEDHSAVEVTFSGVKAKAVEGQECKV